MSGLVPRHEAWRCAYRSDRYMSGLNDGELDLRFADVMTNSTILKDEGKIGIGQILWMEKFAHLQEELGSRGRELPPADSLGTRLITPPAEKSALGESVRKQVGGPVPSAFTLFKYGNLQHLKSLHFGGHLRLFPASHYNDPSLNAAVADSELTFEKIRGSTRTRYRQKSDFYCFCSSWLHRERLIFDFSATAVLVVTDPLEFFLRLATALNRTSFDVRFNGVTYVDPLLLEDKDLTDLRFVKHMRFAYQTEHRWVATPPKPMGRLEVVQICLGPLTDISVLHGA